MNKQINTVRPKAANVPQYTYEIVDLIPEKGTTPTLLEILSYRRGHESEGEQTFINKHLKPLQKEHERYFEDEFGNILVVVEDADGTVPGVLHNAHTDTCHGNQNKEVYQRLRVRDDGQIGLVPVHLKPVKPVAVKKAVRSVAKGGKRARGMMWGEVLGADDGAGLYIMLRMLSEKVPGYYLFTRAEEVGGLGVSHVIGDTSDYALLPNIDIQGVHCMISYDRMDKNSIITSQTVGDCASEAFAGMLSTHLAVASDYSIVMCPDDTGSYTDSAAFIDLVTHVTNLSVGYSRQHTSSETQDGPFLEKLTEALLAVDWYSVAYLAGMLPEAEEFTSYYNSRSSIYYKGSDLGDFDVYEAENTYEDRVIESPYLEACIKASPKCQDCNKVEHPSFVNATCVFCGSLEEGEDNHIAQQNVDQGDDE